MGLQMHNRGTGDGAHDPVDAVGCSSKMKMLLSQKLRNHASSYLLFNSGKSEPGVSRGQESGTILALRKPFR